MLLGVIKLLLGMNRQYLEDVLAFAEQHKLMNTPFQEVIRLYNIAWEETYEDAMASMINSSMEQHELDFQEAI